MTCKKLEFKALENLREDLTYRIDEIESQQTELETLKKIREKIDAKINELRNTSKQNEEN
jgi:cell division protein FtsB